MQIVNFEDGTYVVGEDKYQVDLFRHRSLQTYANTTDHDDNINTKDILFSICGLFVVLLISILMFILLSYVLRKFCCVNCNQEEIVDVQFFANVRGRGGNNLQELSTDGTATQELMNKLQTYAYQNQDCNQEFTCAICLESLKAEEEVMRLSCLHQFHRSCIEGWVKERKSSSTCPLCGKEIFQSTTRDLN
eukprot:TRINITY_DN6941_c2_g3_i1.p2 TRINITY_DN6941_c2_g3~~TRINITY_DN6941_c2_g3_i1.p2  ORF type:complete len:191 (+),score=21.31 TRINITY_DN6941_c2_g3_i1:276-848(+)